MRKEVIIVILFVAFFLVGCAAPVEEVPEAMEELDTTQEIVTSADDPGPPGTIHNLPRGCYVMKQRDADVFECFGCVEDICKDEDRNVWDYYDQDKAAEQGYSCKETPEGCELVEEAPVEEVKEETKAEEVKAMGKVAVLETSMGTIKIELFEDMPITAGNFEKLVKEGFYDGVIFHRVIPNFMVQGGDPTGTGRGGPGYKIKDEFTDHNRNDRGTISMANSGPDTGGSQFFLNVVDNNGLDSKHPVFGKVIEGMDVVDAIVNVKTDAMDKPLTDVAIKKAYIAEN